MTTNNFTVNLHTETNVPEMTTLLSVVKHRALVFAGLNELSDDVIEMTATTTDNTHKATTIALSDAEVRYMTNIADEMEITLPHLLRAALVSTARQLVEGTSELGGLMLTVVCANNQ